MLEKDLLDIGLSRAEATAYRALLESGPTSVLDVAHKSKLNRSTVYYALQSLKNKDLVTDTVNGQKKLVKANSPVSLKRYLEKKLEQVDPIIAELDALARVGDVKPVISYYEGIDGIKKVFNDAAYSKEKCFYVIAGLDKMNAASKTLMNYWLGPYSALRKKLGTQGRIILPDTPSAKEYRRLDKDKLRETRFVPASNYNFESEFLVYDDVLVTLVFSPNELFAARIQSRAIANTMKMVWRLVWNEAY